MSTNDKTKVRIRMYRQGLGDCFLLTFYTGIKPVHMLVDCGTLGATTTGIKIHDVVADIEQETKGHLHLLVVTHEHKDHVSGFASEWDIFKKRFHVDQVWVAWTENPKDPLAIEVAKYKNDFISSLSLAVRALCIQQVAGDQQAQPLQTIAAGVRELLGFYGELSETDELLGVDFAQTVHEAMSNATMCAGRLPDFRCPGEVIQPSWLPGVRFYVLGPPRDTKALTRLGDENSPDLYHFTAESSRDLEQSLRFSLSNLPLADYRYSLEANAREQFDVGLPFDPCFRIEENDRQARARCFQAYDDPSAAWRRIDGDWLGMSGDLALQLDNVTNNTSIVLAIELIDDGRVLLLPGDAQLGNWQSWATLEFNVHEADGTTRVVKAADLLAKTVFYKVGHHASQNGTRKEAGLEAMQRDDLVAFIPVDRAVALKKTPPWYMPARALNYELIKSTHGRVLRSDTGWPDGTEQPPIMTQEEWEAVRADKQISVERMYIEYRLS